MTTQTDEFLRLHPNPRTAAPEVLSQCLQRLAACAQACQACADACLAEEEVRDLVPCIRLNLDCADVCTAAERVLTRRTAADPGLQGRMLSVCADFCAACARECLSHGDRHEHCRLCSDTCLLCEDACRKALASL
ncbi:hypothetical protein [Nocardiopsis potens]|uniref:hypothetical protein n=1 Tax=Nocardiopsis potens TaxID=1246458 RepID=UPI00034A9E03|nr:hypothetical protein [Nocardiopsis potens]